MYPTQYWINTATERLVETSTPQDKWENNIPASHWLELSPEEYELYKLAIVYVVWRLKDGE